MTLHSKFKKIYILIVISFCFIKLDGFSILNSNIHLANYYYEDGLEYKNICESFPEPMSIHIIDIDPAKYSMRIEAAQKNKIGRDTVSNIAKRENALLAVNGNFFEIVEETEKDKNHLFSQILFFDGIPSSILKVNNLWFTAIEKYKGCIGWSKGGKKVAIDKIDMKWWLKIENKKILASHINRVRKDNETVIYFSTLGESTHTDASGTEIVVEDNKITAINKNIGDSKIPQNGFVFSIGKDASINLQDFKIGTACSYFYEVSSLLKKENASDWNNFDYILGGIPVLIYNGQKVTDFSSDNIVSYFKDFVHPRTAIGIKQNGHWVIVIVEGRQLLFSIGMTLNALADLLVELGCVDAINLDGGGSSTLVFSNKILNNPNDHSWSFWKNRIPKERKVADAVLINKR
ncbi:TPA: hypothetical protein DEO28_02190 [Candidatus Dependentiae bacterium]|nr:MAG: hypothetical protein UR14_C0009G0015 [candidate division TM6 bacterium GW2011_GWE2_31_21]KKP52544.1 MAG: hypothetical protein UR43_C0012G0013 [candidate division TM6 bacterium GW2011_GWF2_33_332]HBS48450.1 hypothetical protein [Candidatus Dependentiae bacterium]HBZ73299.1 hypothetical protein [Candidatus Dependentiae bacterium]